MSTKIGLLSDVHACPAPVQEALSIFDRENVAKIICPGDIAGYFEELEPTIDLLIKSDCETIIGNHDQSWLQSHDDEKDTKSYQYLNKLPKTLTYNIEGKTVYVVHAHPPDSQHGGIKLLNVEGEIIPDSIELWANKLENFAYDILIVGHTHQVYAEQIGNVFVINPGSSQFNHTCMILNLPEMTVQTFALSEREPKKSWNFGMFVRNGYQ